jgi:lysyl-tRNA synthetase class 2
MSDRETDPLSVRLSKLVELEQMGVDPYPSSWEVTDSAADLVEAFKEEEADIECRIAGRVVAVRRHGKTTFFHLADRSGRIQAYLRQDELGDTYELVDHLDIGDFVGVAGHLFRTRTGEITVRVREAVLLAKALRPLPFGKLVESEDGDRSYHRVVDREFRYRQRYADLAVRPEARGIFERRSQIIRYLRNELESRGFLEVETPVLQPVYGGATARPFVTHHQALGVPLYLRIADELYLKRCVVGGLERVYEVAKDFRNEGIDRFHSPEFTMLEFYQAYADYEEFMVLAEELLVGLVEEVTGGAELTYQGRTVDVTPPWPRLGFLDALSEHGVAVDDLSRSALITEAERHDIEISEQEREGKILEALFDHLVEPTLDGPVFVINHPRLTSPLAKIHPNDPRLVERFEAYLFSREWANAFSELNDPRDQRRRFEDQAELAAAGDLEAPNVVDEDFLRALEYGMPPTAGMGIGIDRLVMFLTDQPAIRDVILFPALRPEEGQVTENGDHDQPIVEDEGEL